jgi:peroxiredoxin
MAINVGDPIPEAKLMMMSDTGPESISSGEFFAGRKIVLFSVPGAFTPTCSAKHLPGFVARADEMMKFLPPTWMRLPAQRLMTCL